MLRRYKNVVIKDPHEAPTEDEISAIESKLGATLPADFLEFLAVANGGSLEDYNLDVPLIPNPETLSYSRIFTTHNGPGSFLEELKLLRHPLNPRIPEKVLPVADDGAGSYLYLDLRQSGKSPILAFIYGLPSWTGLHQRDELIQVAESISGYLKRLNFDPHYTFELLQAAFANKNEPAINANIEYLDLALPNWREKFNNHDDQLP